jgi:hypothetical protein
MEEEKYDTELKRREIGVVLGLMRDNLALWQFREEKAE